MAIIPFTSPILLLTLPQKRNKVRFRECILRLGTVIVLVVAVVTVVVGASDGKSVGPNEGDIEGENEGFAFRSIRE